MSSPFLSTSPLASLPPAVVEAITQAGHREPFDKGMYIFRRGEPGDCMYIVLEGEVKLVFGQEMGSKTMRAGDFFGELALLTPNHVRTGSAVALDGCVLCRFDPGALEDLSRITPRLVVSFLRTACNYLLASEQKLAQDLRQKNRELENTLDYLRRTFEELSYQELLAHTDELTGLYNRRCLALQIEKFMERSRSTQTPLALIALDLDGLKPINDTYGHPRGDEVLKHVGTLIRSCVRKSDLPCRVGGDEFSILLSDITPKQALERAESLRLAIAQPFPGAEDPPIEVTASIGGTLYDMTQSADAFLKDADRHLYTAKASGGNCISWNGALPPPEDS